MSRILFLSQWFPFPITNGSKLRISNLLRALSGEHDVTLLSFADQAPSDPDRLECSSFCREVQVIPRQAADLGRRARPSLLSKTPRSFVAAYSPAMADLIRGALAAKQFDLVIASQTTMAAYAPHFGKVPALFEEAELGVYYDQYAHAPSVRQRLRYALTWIKHRSYLSALLKHFQACTVVSAQEQNLLRSCAGEQQAISIVPNFVRLEEYQMPQALARPDTLVFTGSFRYFANYDGIVWFLKEIFPQIRSSLPDIRLIITGDHASLPLPSCEGVELKGVVDDIRPIVAGAWISLVPLRIGGGTRLKILEAMALGTPVITTSKGAEGLDVRNGEHLVIADTPQSFAEQVVRLARDRVMRKQLAENALQLVRSRYDAGVVLPQFLRVVEQIVPA